MHLSRRAPVAIALVLIASLFGSTALAAPLNTLVATYAVPSPPATIGAGATAQIAVQLTNTGTDAWPSSGANPVNLSYHWYDQAGTTVVWDGARTGLGGDVAPGGTRTVTAAVVAPAAPGVYVLKLALVKEGVAWFAPSSGLTVTVQSASYSATYQVTGAPAGAPAGGTATLQVTLANTGNQTWNATGANPVNLAYHWYDASGANVVVWDGARTALGADVAPGATRALAAAIGIPAAPGSYVLKLALVKEGVAWFAPGPAMAMNAQAAYVASFTAPALPAFIAGGTYTIPVTVANTGAASWNATGANIIDLSYHWYDASGANVVVWDGLRTALAADVASGASATLSARIATPQAGGTYTLVIDMVREGIGWFGTMGSTPFRATASVDVGRFAASYAIPASIAAYWAEPKTVSVAVTNTGNQTWSASGANPVDLAYHILDGSGNAVVWDGTRTPIGADIAPGQSRTLTVAFTAPSSSGSYTLVIDLVREGIAWFADGGSAPARMPFAVTSGLSAGYGASTTPAQITIGAVVDITVQLTNYGPRTWPAAGANPVHLSYHIYGANTGATYVWDGARGTLPNDLAAGSSATVPISVSVPSGVGDYVIAWDLVQEGVAWFSQTGVQTKREPFSVVSGVVFYGSGFGHGVGMSQYGAQGWATGAAGPALTGEQIMQKYFPGTAFQFGDAARPFNRVLLSQPSSYGSYRCGTNAYFAGSLGDVYSAGGFKMLDEANGNALIATAAPNADWQFVSRNGVVEVWNNGGAVGVRVGTYVSVGVVPLSPSAPLHFVQKEQTVALPGSGFYRGNLEFKNLGDTLRVINVLSYDDYTRGVISFEMPSAWHPEALKAQAYAARSYAYASYRGSARDYDVSDDQGDQCYGGVAAEKDSTNAAVAATSGKLVTYQGGIVKTYFASSSGGYTLDLGCWGNRVVQSGGTWVCTPDATQPYYAAVADPADRLVSSPPNPRASWSVTFTSADIANAVICAGGPNIGTLLGVDLSNQSPAGVGHVISVRVLGSVANADVKAEKFFRSCLGLRSTMVRLSPF